MSQNPGQSGPRTILSIFPKEQELQLRHQGITTYFLPAATKANPTLLRVNDTYTWNRNWSVDDIAFYQAAIPANTVADNLVHSWAQSMVGARQGFGPGIMVIAGSEPTKLELETVHIRQEEFFNFLINQADDFEQEGKRFNITDVHRLAAEWMGVQGRSWAKVMHEIKFVSCPACQEDIRAGALVCRHCSTDLEEFAEKRASKAKAIAPKPVTQKQPVEVKELG